MVAAGVDIVEVGLPVLRPADGRPRHPGGRRRSRCTRARRPTWCCDVVARSRRAGATAVVMSYWNPIERYGVERFADRLADAGGVRRDHARPHPRGGRPLDRRHRPRAASTGSSSSRRPRPTPGSPTVAAATSGFVYAASTMGVTGARAQVSSAAPELVPPHPGADRRCPSPSAWGCPPAAQAADVARLRRRRDRRLGLRPAHPAGRRPRAGPRRRPRPGRRTGAGRPPVIAGPGTGREPEGR